MTHPGTHEEGVTSGGLRNVRHFGTETGTVEVTPRICRAPRLILSGDGCLWIGQKEAIQSRYVVRNCSSSLKT